MKHIVTVPNPVLRKVSDAVVKFDKETKEIVENLWWALENSSVEGVGIAAPQIGVLKRIFILREGKNNYTPFINPRLVWESEERGPGKNKKGETFLEGCLSIPNVYGPVIRPAHIEVEYFDLKGKKTTRKFSEPFSRYFLHEHDHLNGILFTDHIVEQKGKMYWLNEQDELEEMKLG